MKRLIAKSLTVFLSIIVIVITCGCCITASAESAGVGDMVVARVTVGGEPNMISLSATVAYDKESFDLLSYDVPFGSSSCNDKVSGEFSWANIYDMESGLDFTAETDVLYLTFIAKRDISDIDGNFTCTIKEAYDADFKEVDMSKISIYAVVYGDNEQDFAPASSKSSFVISKYEGIGNTSSVSSVESEFDANSLKASEADTNTAVQSHENAVDDSETNEQNSTSSGVIESVTQNGVVISYDESEYKEQPPIRFDTIEKADSSENRKSAYMVGIVIGCVVIAVIAGILIIFKDRIDSNQSKHYK